MALFSVALDLSEIKLQYQQLGNPTANDKHPIDTFWWFLKPKLEKELSLLAGHMPD